MGESTIVTDEYDIFICPVFPKQEQSQRKVKNIDVMMTYIFRERAKCPR